MFSILAAISAAVFIAVILWGVIAAGKATVVTLLTFGALVLLSGLRMAKLAGQRVEFTSDGFVYRAWGGGFAVLYREIVDVEWITPSRTYVSAEIQTVDGARHTFPLKLFPKEVARRLAQIVQDNQSRWADQA